MARAGPAAAAGGIVARATEAPSSTAAPSADAPTSSPSGSARMGAACFTTSSVDTTSCALTTDGGRVRTASCVATQVAQSECRPGLMCSTDGAGRGVCMERRDALDTGGVVVAVLFGALVALALGVLAFLCCRDRRQQKRFAAKAEAVALARAHTRKKKQLQQQQQQQQQQHDARAPLMHDGAPASPNPFHDATQP